MPRKTIHNAALSKELANKDSVERKWMYVAFATKQGMRLTAQILRCDFSVGSLYGFPKKDEQSTFFSECRWTIPTSSIKAISIFRATPGSPIVVETVDVTGLSRKEIGKNVDYIVKKYGLFAYEEQGGCIDR